MKTCKTRKCGTTISNHKIGSKEYRTVAIWRLYINFAWIVAYDTMYAMADRADDVRIGVKSTAILLWATICCHRSRGFLAVA